MWALEKLKSAMNGLKREKSKDELQYLYIGGFSNDSIIEIIRAIDFCLKEDRVYNEDVLTAIGIISHLRHATHIDFYYCHFLEQEFKIIRYCIEIYYCMSNDADDVVLFKAIDELNNYLKL